MTPPRSARTFRTASQFTLQTDTISRAEKHIGTISSHYYYQTLLKQSTNTHTTTIIQSSLTHTTTIKHNSINQCSLTLLLSNTTQTSN